jgi:hypothetical protein
MRAMEFTRRQGSVVTIIKEEDVRKYEGLLRGLKSKYGIEPIISEKTMVENDLTRSNFHHTIGVFKPSKDDSFLN